MFCPSCGTANPDSRFCINCGVEVNPAAQVASEISGSNVGSTHVAAAKGASAFFKKPRNILAVAGGLLLVVAVAVGVSVALTPNPLVQAVAGCSLEGAEGIELTDGDKTLIIDTEGEEDYEGASYDDYLCITEGLNLPERIKDSMGKTRALDGTMNDTFENLTLTWRYHPDSGIDLTVAMD